MIKRLTENVQKEVVSLIYGAILANKSEMSFEKDVEELLDAKDTKLSDVVVSILTNKDGDIKVHTTIATNKGYFGEKKTIPIEMVEKKIEEEKNMIDREKLHKQYIENPDKYFRKWYFCNKINPTATKREWKEWSKVLDIYDNLS